MAAVLAPGPAVRAAQGARRPSSARPAGVGALRRRATPEEAPLPARSGGGEMAEASARTGGNMATAPVADAVIAAGGAHAEIGPAALEATVLPTPNTAFRVVLYTGAVVLAARVVAVDT